MPRYFFNVHHSVAHARLAVSPDGVDLPNADAAREHVQSHARDMVARTHTDIARDWMVCSFEITDEAGQPVLTVPFSDMI